MTTPDALVRGRRRLWLKRRCAASCQILYWGGVLIAVEAAELGALDIGRRLELDESAGYFPAGIVSR
ncbi:hypothetical protein [Streptomyces violaceusniger]|uniref:Uncharacterized protein n=1 Tax=Streptomyces violaceusniger TaxID=68280 RepID=A0A4D4L2V4_STRVO|nr:hypothetical protein SVIO_038930 [Streptomyces violaceusniger]